MSSVSPPAVLILPAVLFPLRIELRFLVRIPGTIGTTRTCGTLCDKLLGLAVVSILLNRAIIYEYILPVLWKLQLKYNERPIFWYCACSHHCDTEKERIIVVAAITMNLQKSSNLGFHSHFSLRRVIKFAQYKIKTKTIEQLGCN